MADNKKKKIVAGIMSGLTAFSLTLGGLFDSAEELKADYPQNPKAVIESIDDYSEDNLEENEAHDSFKEKLKRLIYKIPVKIRTVFFVPLWALGSLLISLIDTLFKTSTEESLETVESQENKHKVDPDEFALYKKYL